MRRGDALSSLPCKIVLACDCESRQNHVEDRFDPAVVVVEQDDVAGLEKFENLMGTIAGVGCGTAAPVAAVEGPVQAPQSVPTGRETQARSEFAVRRAEEFRGGNQHLTAGDFLVCSAEVQPAQVGMRVGVVAECVPGGFDPFDEMRVRFDPRAEKEERCRQVAFA